LFLLISWAASFLSNLALSEWGQWEPVTPYVDENQDRELRIEKVIGGTFTAVIYFAVVLLALNIAFQVS
jgi:hypothetical protein